MQQLKDAIRLKDMAKIQQILAYPNANKIVNMPDKDQQTPLFWAGLHEDQEFGLQAVNMLLEKGADPYHKQDNKETLIYYLASNSHLFYKPQTKLKFYKKCLSLGFNLNEVDTFGQTPLFFAASRGRLKCAQLLIKNGTNVNHLDSNGQTCLFWAAKQGHLQMCKQLINRGCNPAVVDSFKKTAATWARNQHHNHVLDYLNIFKKEKNVKPAKSNSESVQMQKKAKKKQQSKSQYLLVYTGDDGQTRTLTAQQVQQFLKQNQNISNILQDPEQLQEIQINQSQVYKACNKILTMLLKRQDTIAFYEPVKWQESKLFDYPTLIKQPMDYSTMKSKLAFNCYKTEEDFAKDIHLVYDNCIKYNGAESVYGKLAQKLKHEYDSNLRKEFGNQL